MATIKTKGQCAYCKKEYAQSGITRHLQSCADRQKLIEREVGKSKILVPVYHLRIQGKYNPFYWLNVELSGTSHLNELDHFLREIWVECCGHLSAFRIGQQSYMSHLFDNVVPYAQKDEAIAILQTELEAEKKELLKVRDATDPLTQLFLDRMLKQALHFDLDMSAPLSEILESDTKFFYEYDFGSTTYLDLRVIDIRQGRLRKGEINILARNNAPEFSCEKCGKPATQICPQCGDWGEGYFCATCAKKHEHYEYYDEFMPFVNSPRVGVCGYGY